MPTPVVMPQMGESIAEGTIVRWIKKVGDHVDRDEPLFEITTDKVDAEIPSPAAGTLTKILAAENETVAVNTVVAIINGQGAAEATKTVPTAAETSATDAGPESEQRPTPALGEAPFAAATAPGAAVRPGGKLRSSPLVRRIAREHNVDLSRVRGTGLGGRISKKEILKFLEGRTPDMAGVSAVR